jgi:His/Glu/Gln/Arg/opine family amino acid ABC transporter permease subunit
MNWSILLDYREALWHGFVMTIQITVVAGLGGFFLGVWLACLRQLSLGVVDGWISAYVELMRDLPAVVKLFFLYFVCGWGGFTATVVGLSLHHSAYICDAADAGFRSVAREQSEAAWALGHRRSDIFRLVLLPQAWSASIPSITNQLIEVLKN